LLDECDEAGNFIGDNPNLMDSEERNLKQMKKSAVKITSNNVGFGPERIV
jgi:hypothetical protein